MTAGLNARVEWMRGAALLAAEELVRLAPDAQDDPRAPSGSAHWTLLAAAADPDVPLADWLFAAIAAAERYPDAAAAFSILAEDERMALVTPASFARIAASGLGADYDHAVALALDGGPLGQRGIIERIAPAAAARTLSQHGMRLAAGGTGMLFGKQAPVPCEDAEMPPAVVLFPGPARAAANLLKQTGSVWIRSGSRRTARQFALDLAGTLGRGAVFHRMRDETVLPPGEEDRLPVLDLFDIDRAPVLPMSSGTDLAVVAPHRMEHPGLRAVDAPALGPLEFQALWQTVPLPPAERETLARRFHLTLPELRAAMAEADLLSSIDHKRNGGPPAPLDAATMARAIRAEGARRMGPSVTLVESDVTLDDLVAGPQMRAVLQDAVGWHRHSAHVWADMGLRRDAADARGLSLLFSGPPGGGKTFAARCLANALELNLYRIDLSQVVSKYIGETEKALARVFDEAEAGHGVLFFDEADAIFGKRSEVKDAHDRYANIEVGFLLQRMESFDGVMVLATNLRANLDPAFLRRIRFVVDFPMPGRMERRQLWDRNLPAPDWRAPELDIDELAERFRLSGGNIRNAAIAAAHLAAADHAPLGPAHLTRALARELEKSGLPRAPKDFGPLAEYLEGSP